MDFNYEETKLGRIIFEVNVKNRLFVLKRKMNNFSNQSCTKEFYPKHVKTLEYYVLARKAAPKSPAPNCITKTQ